MPLREAGQKQGEEGEGGDEEWVGREGGGGIRRGEEVGVGVARGLLGLGFREAGTGAGLAGVGLLGVGVAIHARARAVLVLRSVVVACGAEDVLACGLDDGGHGVDGEFEETGAGDVEQVLGKDVDGLADGGDVAPRGEDADHLVEDVGGEGEGVGGQATEEHGVQGQDGHVDFGEDAPELGFFVAADGRVRLDGVFAGAGLGESDKGNAGGEIEELADGNGDGRLGGYLEVLDELANEAGKSLGAGGDTSPGGEGVGFGASSGWLTVSRDCVDSITGRGLPRLANGTEDLVGRSVGLLDIRLDALLPLVAATVLGRRVVKDNKQRAGALSQTLGNGGSIGHSRRDVSLEDTTKLGVEGPCGGREQGDDFDERASNGVDKGRGDLGGLAGSRRLDDVHHGSDEAGKSGRGHLSDQCLVALEEGVDLSESDDT